MWATMANISREPIEWFCHSLAHFVAYFWECCPSGSTTKINRKRLLYPHFTIKARRQVRWIAPPNEHHPSGSVPPMQDPASFVNPLLRATLRLSSGAQRFPAAFQSKRIG